MHAPRWTLPAHATSLPAMYAPHVLPAARDYAAMVRSFRWQVPARYNIGVDACDRWAEREPGRTAILQRARRRRRRRHQLRRAARDLEPARQRAGRARHRRAATGSRSCCRSRRRSRPRISRSTSSARSRCRSRCCSASRRSRYRLQDSGARALITNAHGLAKLAQIGRSRGGPRARAVGRRRRRRRARFRRDAGARVVRFHAARHRGRRSGADDLHLGHHRPAEGRAARPSRAARASARHRVPPRIPAAAGRPVLDAGRLGLGRRPAQRAAARPALRRAGGRARGSRSSIRRRPSR